MIYLIANLFAISLISFLLLKSLKDKWPISLGLSALLLRFILGIIAGIIFFEVYPDSDSISFFKSASLALETNSLWAILSGEIHFGGYANQPRVIFFIQILSCLLLLTGGSYWITTLYFGLMSFGASLYFVTHFSKIFPQHKTMATYCFLFIPSVLFWSSGIMKDTLSFAAFIILVIQSLKLTNEKMSLMEVSLGLLSIIVLYKIKHYLLITWLLYSGIVFGIYWYKKMSGALRWTSILVIASFLTLTQFIHPYLTFDRIPQTIFGLNHQINANTDPEKQLDIIVDQPTWVAVINEIPKSLVVGLFRPNVFDSTPLLGLPHKVENLVLLTLAFLTVLLFFKEKPKINWGVLLPALFCIAVLATLLTMTSPNLGTLVRYKNAFLPFLFLIFSILPYQYFTSKSE
jgi:hypothetical protein